MAKASHIADFVAPSELAKAVGALRRFGERGVRPATAQQPLSQGQSLPVRPALRVPPFQHADSAPADPRPLVDENRAAPAPASRRPAEPIREPAASPPSPSVPVNLSELKKSLAVEIRKNNVLLGTTLEKSGSWRFEGGVLRIAAATRMEFDLLKRFSGIIAEFLAQKLGSPQRVEFELEGSPGGWSVLEQGRPAAETPTAFNDGASAPTRKATSSSSLSSSSPSAGNPVPAQDPGLSQREQEALGLVERYFKGTVVGYANAQVPGTKKEPPKADQPDFQTQD